MSSIEERLVLDIATVTKGVVVTERDLLDAQSAVDERVDSRRRRDHRRTAAVVAAAAVVVAGVGLGAFQAFSGEDQEITPAGSGPSVDIYADFLKGEAPTPENLNGFWRLDNGTLSLLFDEDGTVRIDHQGMVVSSPESTGTYEVSGDTISVTVTDSGTCAGAEFAMLASLPNQGQLHAVNDPGSSSECDPLPLGSVVWEHVLPTSPQIAGYHAEDSGWEPLSGKTDLTADWFAEGGGHILETAPGGAYYILGDGADRVDQGQWTLRGTDLVLTSSALSAQCREGDELVLGAVEQMDIGTLAIRGTVEQNTCDGAWTPKAWLMVPNLGS